MGFVNWISNSNRPLDAIEAEKRLREKYPLFLHESERIELAFQAAMDKRDKAYLTSHRILIQDGKGLSSKRKRYTSIPYRSMQAFSVETAGVADVDVELKVYAAGHWNPKRLFFAVDSVDIFQIKQFLNTKMDWDDDERVEETSSKLATNGEREGASHHHHRLHVDGTPPPVQEDKRDSVDKLFDWVGRNTKQLEPREAEDLFKTVYPILLQDETVDMAFKAARDFFLFTSKRVLEIDVQGVYGKKIEFWSYPWRSFSGFSVETAGKYLDRDSELNLYTTIFDVHKVSIDFRKESVNVLVIQQYIAAKLLDGPSGTDTTTTPSMPDPEVDRLQGHQDDAKGSWWFRDNQRPLDSVEMTRFYQEDIPILQRNETVEFAFKGRRDITLFTTKRIIDIDPKGWKGIKIEYSSVPWKSVVAFGCKTAGKHVDYDAEVKIWTDMRWKCLGSEEEEADPSLSYLELDFNKNLVDVLVLKRYLSIRLLGMKKSADDDDDNAMMIPPETFMTSPPMQGVEKFLSWLGDDQQAIDPTKLNMELHSSTPILLDNEHIVMAFKAYRDVTVFTNLRCLELDVQGWSGKKVKYTSVPYTSIRAFSAECAGQWDRDSEVGLYTTNQWDLKKFKMDFRKGKADIVAIQKFLAAIILGDKEEAAAYLSSSTGGGGKGRMQDSGDPAMTMDNAISWLGSTEVDPIAVDQKLHSEPNILLQAERVVRAYEHGRDLYVHTTNRLLIIDVQGLLGKRVQYKSIPLEYATGIAVETAGHLDTDYESYVYFNIPEKRKVEQSYRAKHGDVFETHQYLSNRFIFLEEPSVPEPKDMKGAKIV